MQFIDRTLRSVGSFLKLLAAIAALMIAVALAGAIWIFADVVASVLRWLWSWRPRWAPPVEERRH